MAITTSTNVIYPSGIGGIGGCGGDPLYDQWVRMQEKSYQSSPPHFSDEKEMEAYINRIREQNHWMHIEAYKKYLRFCEKNYPDDKIIPYHQKDKWREDLKTFEKSGLFDK